MANNHEIEVDKVQNSYNSYNDSKDPLCRTSTRHKTLQCCSLIVFNSVTDDIIQITGLKLWFKKEDGQGGISSNV